MNKRTVIAVTFSLICWAVLQVATQALMPSVASPRFAPQVHAQEDSSPITLPAGITQAFSETMAAKLAQSLTDTTPISITDIVTASDVITVNLAATESPAVTEVPAPEEPITSTEDTSETTDSAPTDDPVADDVLPPGQADLSQENPVLGIVEGTILANRTDVAIKFFVQGQIYEVAGLRSVGLNLPRASTVLNLYNCDAAIPETDEGCFWDPYMVDRDGFYDIVSSDGVDQVAKITLKEAGGPSGAAIWIQNRSPQAEIVVYRNAIFDLLPGALREFAVDNDALPTFFVRSCLEVDGEAACEWVPVVVTVGVRYALIEVETSGGLPNSLVSILELRPLDENGEVVIEPSPVAPEEGADADVTDAGTATTSPTPEPVTSQGSQMICTLLVPVLNVRSGPGFEYEIIAKVRSSENESATVLIIGRDATGEWLAVDEVVAPGGWITGSANFVSCDKAVTDLAEVEVTDGRLAPVPTPETAEPAAEEAPETDAEAGTENGVEGDGIAVEEVSAPAIEVPKGQALLLVNNGFDQELRFTLDQKYRVEPGPSEYDLGPGDSVQIFVYPGLVGFSASTAWRGLSDNRDFFLEEEQTQELWLFFMPDPDGSGRWILQY